MKKAVKISWCAAVLLLSVALGFSGFNYFIGKPQVGVINISGIIWQPSTTDNILKMLRYAADTPSIKAVVLVIDSPGGLATPSEEIYLDALRLKDKKPIVASLNLVAASGGYYIAAAAHYIYAKSTSYVGSVGAFTSLPEPEEIEEGTLSTGPFKATGVGVKRAMFQLEMLKETFLQSVISQRGDRLKLSKEELSQAEIYNGMEAVRNGLIDELGTTTDAIGKAAEYARLRNYKLVDINDTLGVATYPSFFFGKPFPLPSELVPINLYLYREAE